MSNISTKIDGDTLNITISGQFNFNLVQSFRQAYANDQASGKSINIDLSSTDYIDSSALGMLINMKKSIGAEDLAISISNCPENLMKIFTISNFEKKFKFL
jgi:anti-anti-sigma factor